MTHLDRSEMTIVSSGMLAGLALCILKGHWWHDSFHNTQRIERGREKGRQTKHRPQHEDHPASAK
jgi:hypothetical protein